MSEAKHTPGPWRIGRLASYDGYTGQPFRNVWAGKDETATVVARAIRSKGAMTNDVDADACLIAAAPELLEELRAAGDFVSELLAILQQEYAGYPHKWKYVQDGLERIDAIIVKAEGGAS